MPKARASTKLRLRAAQDNAGQMFPRKSSRKSAPPGKNNVYHRGNAGDRVPLCMEVPQNLVTANCSDQDLVTLCGASLSTMIYEEIKGDKVFHR